MRTTGATGYWRRSGPGSLESPAHLRTAHSVSGLTCQAGPSPGAHKGHRVVEPTGYCALRPGHCALRLAGVLWYPARMSIALLLLVSAFIVAVIAAAGRAPLWVAVLLVIVERLLSVLPLR